MSLKESMRCIQLQDQFGIDHLHLTSMPIPSPQSQEVLIRVRAVSLNYRDLLMIQGQYNPRLTLPFIPCSDAVGEVVALGNDVDTTWTIGDRVLPIFAQNWLDGAIPNHVLQHTLGGPLAGTVREYMCVPHWALVKAPTGWTDHETSTLNCAALTAWNALVELNQLKAGQHVLCIGTGGVSLFAAQIALLLGAEVTVVSRSEDKILQLQQQGLKVHHWIHSQTQPQWGRILRKQGGVDHVIEVGGAQTIEQSLKALKAGGSMSLIGVLSGHSTDMNLLPILMRQIKVQGVFVGHKRAFQEMIHALSLHEIRPFISHTFHFTQAVTAFQHLAQAQHVGKICLKFH